VFDMNQFIESVNVSAITYRNIIDKRSKAIYRPKGEALEYAQYDLNLYGECSHGCRYCYNQYRFHGSCENELKKATLKNIRADLDDAEALLKRYGRAYKIKATLAVAHNG
jgi:DNA repair photolyase